MLLRMVDEFSYSSVNIDWLIVWCLMPFSTVYKLYCDDQCTYPCFPGVLLTSTPHNIFSKPLAAFPHKRCWNNGQQLERNESCHNDSERILVEPGIEPATSCSQVHNTTDWAMGLGSLYKTRRLTLCQIIKFCPWPDWMTECTKKMSQNFKKRNLC